MTKIQFWKQFTTFLHLAFHIFRLYSVWQRYNFESNLQQMKMCEINGFCCIQYDKDTILKAIYNLLGLMVSVWTLYSVWQRYNFESNLQLPVYWHFATPAVFSMTKIQFWKQFTTFLSILLFTFALYSVWQRYNFESNLQLARTNGVRMNSCIQYDKDTILKAIYNYRFELYYYFIAVFSMTKIQFWKQFTTQEEKRP